MVVKPLLDWQKPFWNLELLALAHPAAARWVDGCTATSARNRRQIQQQIGANRQDFELGAACRLDRRQRAGEHGQDERNHPRPPRRISSA